MESDAKTETEVHEAEVFLCNRCRQERTYVHGYHVVRLPDGREVEACGRCTRSVLAEQPGAVLRRVLLARRGRHSLSRVDGTLVFERDDQPLMTEADGDEFYEHVGVYLGGRVEIAVATGEVPDTAGGDGEE